MKTILITGGTGFVGTHLTNLLRQKEPDARLILLGRESADSPDPQVEILSLDLTDTQAVNALIQNYQPEQIYHLASIAHVALGFSEPASVLRNNFQLTLNLLESVRQFSPASRILLVSSADLYDHTDPLPIDETRPILPLNPYAVSKATQDLMGQAYAASFGLQIIIVRPFNHIGPGQRLGFVVADFASKVVRAEFDEHARTISVGNLDSARDFTDVRDMVAAYYLLMNQGEPGAIYNAGSGTPVKISALLQQLIDISGSNVTVSVDPAKLRPVDHPLIVCNPAKLHALGWQQSYRLEQTLKDILDFWREQLSPEYQGK